jgi:hypothetical protein
MAIIDAILEADRKAPRKQAYGTSDLGILGRFYCALN